MPFERIHTPIPRNVEPMERFARQQDQIDYGRKGNFQGAISDHYQRHPYGSGEGQRAQQSYQQSLYAPAPYSSSSSRHRAYEAPAPYSSSSRHRAYEAPAPYSSSSSRHRAYEAPAPYSSSSSLDHILSPRTIQEGSLARRYANVHLGLRLHRDSYQTPTQVRQAIYEQTNINMSMDKLMNKANLFDRTRDTPGGYISED